MPWKVPAQASASVMTAALSPITLRAIRSTRCVISEAARRENVINRMRRGSAPPTIRCATRCARVLVLPDPAPAITSSGANGPGPRRAVFDGAPLFRIEAFEIGRCHENDSPEIEQQMP